MSNPKFMLGYDYQWLSVQGDKRPLYAPIGHTIVVGGSGSGKSTSVLYWLWKLVKNNDVELTIVDFKASHEFAGIVAEPERFAESNELACYSLIEDFYNRYTSIPEGGDSRIHVLLIDEAAGLLNHLSLTKEGSALANKIRLYLSSLLMGGRSRLCFTWLVMQRYTWEDYAKKFGYITVTKIRHLESVSRYITKYVTKDLAKTRIELNDHLYYCSQGLNRSELIYTGQLTKEL